MTRKDLVLLCISALIALSAAEFIVRAYLGLSGKAVAMTTLPSLVGKRGEVVLYERHSNIREVAIDQYGVVYDANFRTNNLGLIDEIDYPSSVAHFKIAFLGDSFTAGYHGGRPWISELRNKINASVAVFNLGIVGTGIIEFDKRIKWFSDKFKLHKVYVLVISSDFYRYEWYPLTHNQKLWFCPISTDVNDCIENSSPVFYKLDAEWGDDELLLQAKGVIGTGNTRRGGLQMYKLALRNIRTFRETQEMRLAYPQVRANLAALDRLVKSVGVNRITVLHLPEKHEAANGAYDIDLTEYASLNSIDYVQFQRICPFNSEMYLMRDPHPNALGYKRLVDCLAQLVSSP